MYEWVFYNEEKQKTNVPEGFDGAHCYLGFDTLQEGIAFINALKSAFDGVGKAERLAESLRFRPFIPCKTVRKDIGKKYALRLTGNEFCFIAVPCIHWALFSDDSEGEYDDLSKDRSDEDENAEFYPGLSEDEKIESLRREAKAMYDLGEEDACAEFLIRANDLKGDTVIIPLNTEELPDGRTKVSGIVGTTVCAEDDDGKWIYDENGKQMMEDRLLPMTVIYGPEEENG